MDSSAKAPVPLARTRKGGVVVPHPPRWDQRLAARLVFGLARSVSATLRYRWNDRSGYFNASDAGPAIYCVWHNRLALSVILYHRYVRERNRTSGLAALVSASRDGGFLAAVLECLGAQPVRGSS